MKFVSVMLTGMLPATEHSMLVAVEPALLDSVLQTKEHILIFSIGKVKVNHKMIASYCSSGLIFKNYT